MPCLDHAAGRAREDQDVDGTRLSQTRRCRKSLGILRGTVWALTSVLKEKQYGNCTNGDSSAFASIHTRERDSKSAASRRWLEHSRPWESSSGIRDRFTMEESLGVHQRKKRNYYFPISQ